MTVKLNVKATATNDKENNMRAFYRESVEENKSVFYPASKRFKDKNGDPIMWELRVLGYDEMKKITKRHTNNIPNKLTGRTEKRTDEEAMAIEMALASVIYPDLNDSDLQDDWGVIGNEALLKAMLNPGEIVDLVHAVQSAAGYETDMADKIKKVKNS